jgi:hypothetical protein
MVGSADGVGEGTWLRLSFGTGARVREVVVGANVGMAVVAVITGTFVATVGAVTAFIGARVAGDSVATGIDVVGDRGNGAKATGALVVLVAAVGQGPHVNLRHRNRRERGKKHPCKQTRPLSRNL